jgi:hypothetical protein
MQYSHIGFGIVIEPVRKFANILKAVIFRQRRKIQTKEMVSPPTIQRKTKKAIFAYFLYADNPLYAKHPLFAPVWLPLPRKEGCVLSFEPFPKIIVLPDGVDFSGDQVVARLVHKAGVKGYTLHFFSSPHNQPEPGHND